MNDRSDAPPTCPNGHPFPENLRLYGKKYNGEPRTYCRLCRMAKRRTTTSFEPDPVAIERAVAGNPPAYLYPVERAEAVRRLDSRGLTAKQIAARVGCAKRSVHRIRSRARNAA
ncbi:helix-turn-helix domain-containing protein [Streptomyces sp. NPDC021012]|uniref:helix-turn-helix domain-containing protein n=1 Tax=Streptomyces sp. NPDC021012 TaxID=3365107 RepID=UPI0037930857